MATHSSILTWRIPWTEEPGGPQSVAACALSAALPWPGWPQSKISGHPRPSEFSLRALLLVPPSLLNHMTYFLTELYGKIEATCVLHLVKSESPNNSHGNWPFLRPPERVPEVPVVSREHLRE